MAMDRDPDTHDAGSGRRWFTTTLGAAFSVAALVTAVGAALVWTGPDVQSAVRLQPGARPNIVLIIGDDIGFPHYGFMGHPRIATPAMDELVGSGVLFPVAYNSGGMCVPSLETILTGRYQKDFHDSRRSGYGDAYLTVPLALRQAGYVTYQAGKFWSGQKATGFDQWLPNGRDKIGRDTMQPIFDFIDERLTTDQKPFFVWYAPRLPHRPLSSPRYYEDQQRPFPYPDVTPNKTAHFYGNVSWLDDTIGALAAGLAARGLRENTLLLYVADNGWMLPHSKHNMTENGIRTVLWANMPGTVSSGVRRSEMVHTVDILPTLMDFAGLEIPSDMQGRSLKPLLQATSPEPVVDWRQYIFGSNYQSSSTRTRVTSRYVRTQDGFIYYPEKRALYNLNEYPDVNLGHDIRSSWNLIANPEYAALVGELQAAVDAWAPLTPRGGSATATLTSSTSSDDEIPACRRGIKWVFVDINDDGCLDRDQGEYPLTWGALSNYAEPWTDEHGRARLRLRLESPYSLVFPELLEEVTNGLANLAYFVTSGERIYVYSRIFGRKTLRNIESLSLTAGSDIVVGAGAAIGFSEAIELHAPGGDILVLEGSVLRTGTGGPNNRIVMSAPEGEVDVHSLAAQPSALSSAFVEIVAPCSHVDETAAIQSQTPVSSQHCDEEH